MFSVDYVISIMRQRILILVILVLVLEQDLVDSTTGQLLQNLLRHPHYADGHQHSAQHHSQVSKFLFLQNKFYNIHADFYLFIYIKKLRKRVY